MSASSCIQAVIVSATLNQKEEGEIIDFSKKLEYFPHYNNPLWVEWTEPYKKPIFIRFYKNNKLSGFAIVYCRLSFSVLHFGPLVLDDNDVSIYIEQIVVYLRKQKFGLLTIHFPFLNDLDFGHLILNDLKLKYHVSFENKIWY